MSGQRFWGTSAQIIFRGVGMSRDFSGMGEGGGVGRIYKHTSLYIWVGADHISTSGEPLLIFFHVYLVF